MLWSSALIVACMEQKSIISLSVERSFLSLCVSSGDVIGAKQKEREGKKEEVWKIVILH